MTTWNTEQDNQSPEYQAKAHLVLEGSEQHEWGVVKDCHGNINHIPEDAEVVGTWSRYGDGTYWVSLETSLQALQDRATILVAELARRRREEAVELRVARPRAKRTREPEPVVPSAFDELRAKLAGKV